MKIKSYSRSKAGAKASASKIFSSALKPTIVALCVAQTLAPTGTYAAIIQVTHLPDNSGGTTFPLPGGGEGVLDFVCSLREAITSIHAQSVQPGCLNTGAAFGTNDQIIYPVAATFAIGSQLSINSPSALSIDLSGSTITGAGNHRIFGITSGAEVTLENMTVSGGSTSGGQRADAGGGISIQQSAVTINNSTISNNTVAYTLGGGVYQQDGGFTLSNSTVSNNSADIYGGGIRINGPSNTTISHSTLHANSAGTGSSIHSFSDSDKNVSITISNSVISDSPTNQECKFYTDGSGITNVIDAGGNWFEDDTCNGVAQGDPRLGALADNGGATQTHLPSFASPLRNLASSNCSANDQRGESRSPTLCDAGAVEFISMQVLVDSKLDDGTGCTLREALASTNSASLAAGCSIANPGFGINDGQAIYFDPALAGETITLGGSHLDVATGQNIMIDASQIEGMTIDGNNASRVLEVADSAVSLNNLTIKNGQISDNNGDLEGGAGIRANNSSLRLYESTVSNCTAGANSTDKKGGGISSINGSLVLESSTVAYNHAASPGGAIYSRNSSFDIINSTVSNNSTYANVGASAISVIFAQPSSILHSTVSNDIFALKGASGQKISIQNSVINSVCELADDAFMDDGGNWFTDVSCNVVAKGDPGLLPLADNGGPTKTRALKESSGARNGGLASFCAITDQRGRVRNEADGKCDIGAFELFNSDIPINFYTIPLPNGKAVVIPL